MWKREGLCKPTSMAIRPHPLNGPGGHLGPMIGFFLHPSPPPTSTGISRPKVAATDGPFDEQRAAILQSSRRNFPAVEVLPSFNPQQNFEARVWIEAQKDKPEYELPDRVEWSAAMNFPEVVTCPGSTNTDFGARFTYHAPMLIQCRLFWKD